MRPFQPLTTLEEDFKEIGLLPKTEQAPETQETKVESTETKPEAKVETETKADGETLDEVKAVRTKRHTASERMKWKRASRKGKAKARRRKYMKKSSVKRMLKRHARKAKMMRKGKPAGRKRLQFTGLDTLSNLLEQVQQVVAGLSEDRRKQALKAFANMAIIAELVAKQFAKDAASSEDKAMAEHLSEEAELFQGFAEECAEVARALHEGGDFDFDELNELFEENVEELTEGLDLYVALTGDEELAGLLKSEGCGDMDDEEDDDEDEDEEDDEDDDEGEDEEGE